jgi:putative acetyltransferase
METREQDEITIRFVREEDVPAVVALVRDVLTEFGFSFGIGASTDTDVERLPGAYTERGGAFWVAMRRGELLGTCAVFPMGEGVFELRKMFLRESARGLGLGKRLLDESVVWARDHGGRQLVLDTHDIMERAIAFYEANGFVRDDEQMRASRCTRGYSRAL